MKKYPLQYSLPFQWYNIYIPAIYVNERGLLACVPNIRPMKRKQAHVHIMRLGQLTARNSGLA